MAKKRRLRAKNRMGVVVPFDIAASDVTMANGNTLEEELENMGNDQLMKQNINKVQTNVQRLFDKLANMAFWNASDRAEAAPTALDWNVPDKTLAIANNIEHAVVTRNGETVGSSINVSQGETVELIVAGTTGYNVTSVTASSGTATNLGNGTFKVVVKVNNDITLTLTGTTDLKTYSIGYTLTGCGAPSGVTNPTTIQHGGTATIRLEATNGVMPASLPSGAVTEADIASYTPSQDGSSATLVIENVTGDVSITIAAVYADLHKGIFVVIDPDLYYIQRNNATSKRRACLLCERENIQNPCTWGGSLSGNYSPQDMLDYSTIPIPSGATKTSMQCNASYYYGLTLVNSSGVALNTIEWTPGSTKKELNFADYPNATHIAVNFKIGSAGTADFSNETYESMEIDFQIT